MPNAATPNASDAPACLQEAVYRGGGGGGGDGGDDDAAAQQQQQQQRQRQRQQQQLAIQREQAREEAERVRSMLFEVSQLQVVMTLPSPPFAWSFH